MKKIIVTLMMIFCVCVAHAENENISTSQYYVDTKSAEKQDTVPANNANSVMTYDSTSADGIGSKAIYDTTASYAGQSKALVTASTANTAIQNGINNEFVCANPQGGCTLWRIHNKTQQTILPNGYTALEYLETTSDVLYYYYGDQYISTDIPWNTVKRFRGKARQKDSSTQYNLSVLGSSSSSAVTNFFGTRYLGQQGGQREWYWNTNILPTTIAEFDIHKNSDSTWGGTVNNVTTASTTANFVGNVIIMGSRPDDTRNFVGRVWYIQLFDANDDLIFNGIPARRDSDNELGMYDTVTNTFFTNAGDGEFVAGPVANNLYLPQNQQ